MSFELGKATVIDDAARVRMISSAFRKTGKPVVLVPLGAGVHAGHIALIRAAKAIRGSVVIVAMLADAADVAAAAPSREGADVARLAQEGVDVVWTYEPLEEPLRTTVTPRNHGLEPVGELAAALTQQLRLIGTVAPSDVIVGEKDYELMVALNCAVRDLGLPVRVQGVPTVRMPDGLAISLRNAAVAEDARTAASAVSAALTAGAHAAEGGEDAVLEVARAVLAAEGVEPEYLAVRGRDLGPAPEQGDARLLVAATVGGVRLIDNVGLPIGIGFRNIEAAEA